MQTVTVKAIIPTWEGAEEYDTSLVPSFSVALTGATLNVDGGTQIKMNSPPEHNNDYDVRCSKTGILSGEPLLQSVTKVYIWGYGYTVNGSFSQCEPSYKNATEIEISKDTEIVLWGANSE